MLNQSVELALGLLVLILPSGHPHSDFPGHVSDSIGPHILVELSIHSNIVCLHHLVGELPDFTHCPLGLLLKGYLMHFGSEVDSGIDALLTHLLLLLVVLHH